MNKVQKWPQIFTDILIPYNFFYHVTNFDYFMQYSFWQWIKIKYNF